MKIRERWATLSRRTRRVLIATMAVALYALAGFVVIPAVLRAKVPAMLADTLGRPVTIEKIRLNPFALSLAVHGFRIDDTDGQPFVSLDELFVNVQASSLFRRALTLKQIRLTAPRVRLRLLPDGRPSFADIQERFAAGPEEPPVPPGEPFPLIVYRASIERGGVAFRDESRPTPFEEEISPIDISLENFTTRAKTAGDAPYSFSATTETGATLSWQGTLSVFPLRSKGEIRLANFRSRTPWRYLRDDLQFEITSGWADASAKYEVDASADALQAKVSEAGLSLQNVTLFEEGATSPLIRLPSLVVAGGSLDLTQRTIRIASVTSTGTRIRSLRESDGAFHMAKVLAARERSANTAAPAPGPVPQEESPAPPWTVTVDSIEISDYGIAFEDRSTPTPAKFVVEPISLKVTNLTTAGTTPAGVDVSVGFERGGHLGVTGTVTPSGAAADVAVKLTGFALPLVQPYVEAASGAVIREGALNVDVTVTHRSPEGAKATQCDGRVEVAGLNVGTRSGGDVVRFDGLAIEGLSASASPVDVSMAKVRIERPTLNIERHADGSSNMTEAGASPAAPETAAADPVAESSTTEPGAAAAPLKLSIERIEIVDGSVAIKDEGTTPPFALAMTELAASVEGVALAPSTPIKLDLKGKIERTSSLTISATARPNADAVDGKVKLALVGLDTAVFSPYSGKYIGQQIARGKLHLDLDYAVEREALTAANKIRLDSFTLGKKVSSPDAVDLPIGLAIALLKDAKGRIGMDVPVSGRLDNPSFRLGGVIAQTLRDLILKAATAPFALIGGLVGGGDELGHVAFAPGRAELTEPENERLAQLARALGERPSLQLEVPGAASPQVDTPVLREIALEAELKAMHFAELRGKSNAPSGPGEVELDDGLRERLIAELYPLRFKQRVKDLRATAPEIDEHGAEVDAGEWTHLEMRRRLLDAIPIGETELADLARRRADAIVHQLVAAAGVAPERVSTVAPDLNAAGEPSSVQVELVLTAS